MQYAPLETRPLLLRHLVAFQDPPPPVLVVVDGRGGRGGQGGQEEEEQKAAAGRGLTKKKHADVDVCVG